MLAVYIVLLVWKRIPGIHIVLFPRHFVEEAMSLGGMEGADVAVVSNWGIVVCMMVLVLVRQGQL